MVYHTLRDDGTRAVRIRARCWRVRAMLARGECTRCVRPRSLRLALQGKGDQPKLKVPANLIGEGKPFRFPKAQDE